MQYSVNAHHYSMAVHLTKVTKKDFKKCSGWDWWYVVEWQWRGWGCQECEEDKGTDCDDRDTDTDW